jgi:hypothetical protein
MADRSNAMMATNSLDRVAGSGVAWTSAPYNAFRIRAQGGPIIQGQINKIKVGEIRFPYDIPTVVEEANDTVTLQLWDTVAFASGVGAAANIVEYAEFDLTIPQGWFTGDEMASALNAAFAAQVPGEAPWWPDPAVTPVFNAFFNEPSQTITIQNVSTYTPVGGAHNYFFALSPPWLPEDITYWSRPSLMTTLGFRNALSYANEGGGDLSDTGAVIVFHPLEWNTGEDYIYPQPISAVLPWPASYLACSSTTGTPYTGAYTDFIDICSPALCQAQYVRDGSTSQAAIRRDLIVRLYVASETSTREVIGSITTAAGGSTMITINKFASLGSRPFVIHRQFKNAKVMKWTADRSIDAIDLNLYDMYGNPIPVPTVRYYGALTPPFPDPDTYTSVGGGARDYQITFLVDEHEDIHAHPNNVGYSY